MDDSITLTLAGGGSQKRLRAKAFVSAVQAFFGLLQDLDAAISEDPRGTLDWEISGLIMRSPAQITYAGHSILKGVDFASDVGLHCVRGVSALASGAERDRYYSERALYRIRRLAALRRRELSIVRIVSGADEASIVPQTLDNIDALVKGSEEAEGSVLGSLDAISVHRANEFRVWEETSGRPITCHFPDELLEIAKSNLKKRVLVFGTLRISRLGQIVSIGAVGIEALPTADELPSIKQMSGLIEDLTLGLPLSEYMRILREDAS
jgi:hypothetical protein